MKPFFLQNSEIVMSKEVKIMHKPIRNLHSFLDFNQPMGLHMNPNNRWIKMADRIPWDEFEVKYAKLFPSNTGNVAKPLRMALGAFIIQTKFQFSDRALVEQIKENPYVQYFIGLSVYQEEAPFDATCAPANIRYPQDISLLNEAYFFRKQSPFSIIQRKSSYMPEKPSPFV